MNDDQIAWFLSLSFGCVSMQRSIYYSERRRTRSPRASQPVFTRDPENRERGEGSGRERERERERGERMSQ